MSEVIVHPLVLLSAVDHYKRKGTKRVAGILLGDDDGEIHITESFACIFEEDEDGWFMDTSYIRSMFDLFYKVNHKLKVMGWYHTGPRMYENDLDITRSLGSFVESPFLAIINVHLGENDLPVQTFKLDEQDEFVHVGCSIEAEEAEEVGVEHLIRDIREEASGSIAARINGIKESLAVYRGVLGEIRSYLNDVISGDIHLNQEIINLCQEIINSTPKLERPLDENLSDCYVSVLAKTVVALNDLRKNRLESGIETSAS
ncbi:26S PROTEASOME REGULATORY SUBUNIT 12 [Encephalitozoon cuniculi GB-M1]|uniref:26S PROTEASOME REGULATORY SUBUNIT 12 n=2 Tax=Encephalitozoon cuniculi TaxID=6035 RepID=Q8SS61_ENCCU|nr:proteasome regulatory particle lid subunit RPN8 [Encephalitozoon cuniculi GB-M1]AGE95278.1 26S proteasome regulatory subunit 12 [Encephalitozoon cuniculi]KMV66243.1 proteasome 26S non-ATPase subunit 7 [Encephalitozoon cuniculi EcunIII-L]UYI27417.1 proteasome regulatory subunit RPN8 [Encephalitozoon cuniculi]CAD25229.1 26S PROTEASOME REGULATORY SUBUNIT 12 [Encephalitozoon cuniculi GB-M1]